MNIRTVLCLGLVISWMLDCPQADSGERCSVRMINRQRRGSRLAPELEALKESGSRFLGVSRRGRAVFDIPSEHKQKMMSMASEVADVDDDPKDEVEAKGKQILIRYGKTKPAEETLEAAGLRLVKDHELGRFYIVEPIQTVTAQTVDALLADEAVLHAEPDYVVTALPVAKEFVVAAAATNNVPNDPLLAQLWGMKNIHATDVWPEINQANNVIVAVIDTGVDYKHPDLKDNIWSGPNGEHGHDFFDDDEDPMDEQDHGTHCAGTIAGVGDNGVGVVGVNWGTKIMAMRFLGPDGSGSTSDAVLCIDWAVKNGAHILSNSWSGPDTSQALSDAITRAQQKGVLFVAAAGNTEGRHNNDTGPYYPASHTQPNIITVGAIDVNDKASSFTHYGPKSVDIGAPGVGIVSTVRNGKYAKFDGTSMACPHVAGAAALVWTKTFPQPAQNPQQMTTVRDLIYANARKIPSLQNLWGQNSPAKVPGGVLDISFLTQTPGSPGTPSPGSPSIIQPPPGRRTLVERRFKVDPSILR